VGGGVEGGGGGRREGGWESGIAGEEGVGGAGWRGAERCARSCWVRGGGGVARGRRGGWFSRVRGEGVRRLWVLMGLRG